jgi:MerR family transcriptional regulator, thiopeptide resistance regulator
MLLKVGELAKRSGMTVRALHHYDSIGLLSPSARSDAGYRLYNRTDIARLHQVQALRRFGVSLADIGNFLASPGPKLALIVEQQIAALSRQIEQAGLLRNQLSQLRRQLATGEEPDLAAWLTTLELMTMYDKYFTQDELARMPFFSGNDACIAEWDSLIARLRALMDGGTAPSNPAVQQLSRDWMIMLERDTGGDPDLLVKLNAMHEHEPALRARNGITPELGNYVQQAFGAFRLSLYQKYLSPAEFDFMREHYGRRSHEWAPLIARVRAMQNAGVAPGAPEAQAAAREWMELFCSYAGDDPATHLKIRAAHASEPGLMTGTFVTDELLAFIIKATAPAPAR